MKKLLSILLVCVLAVSMTACGGTKTQETTAPKATDPAKVEATADDKLTNDEYQEIVGPLVTVYEELILATNELLLSYDGSEEWINTYVECYQASEGMAETMDEIAPAVPGDYAVSHEKLTIAMLTFNEAYKSMAEMLDALQAKDDATAVQKRDEAKEFFDIAAELWNSVVN